MLCGGMGRTSCVMFRLSTALKAAERGCGECTTHAAGCTRKVRPILYRCRSCTQGEIQPSDPHKHGHFPTHAAGCTREVRPILCRCRSPTHAT